MKKVRASLAGLSYLPKQERTAPKDRFDSNAVSALGAFQLDYNLKWDRVTEAGGLVVAEDVKITLDLELNAAEGN